MKEFLSNAQIKSTQFFLLVAIAFFIANPGYSQQVIGEFSIMDGGMEGQSSGTISTAGSSQSGSPQTNWTVSSSSNSAQRLMVDDTALARSGRFSANVALSTTGTNVRLQSPSSVAPDSLSPSTQYTIQYFYKTNVDPGSYLDGGIYLNNTSGGSATDVTTIGAFAPGDWNKAYVVRTTNSIYNASNWAVARISTPGSSIYLDTIKFDDFVVYAGTLDSVTPGAPDPATMDSTYSVNGPSADLAWNAPGGGVDGGGYVVVKYLTMPAADNDINQNGIYAVGSTTTNGTSSLLGTVVYIGTATSYSDTYTAGAYYKVYTTDKAFNYSDEITLSEALPSGNSKQIIGEFPIMDGGMEGEMSGTISTAGSSQSGTPQITWTVSSSSNSAQRLMVEDSLLARTGRFSADVALSSTATNVRLQSPSTQAPDSLSPSTQYTIQYFYKANTDPGSNLDGGIYLNNTSGGTATDMNNLSTFAPATWTKAYVERTTNSTYNASNWAVARISTPGSNIYLDTITFDDFVVYAGGLDTVAPGAPDPATMDSTYTVTGPSADLAWNAPSGGVDGGGYVVVKYLTMPAPDNDPNQNGIYAIGTTTSNGTANLLGTVIYIGTATSYSDTYTPGAYYKVYTADKAFNYSEEITLSEVPPLVGNSKQIIGEFPIMDGGMEGETSGTISTAGSSQSGTPQITWTVSSSGNSAQRLMVEDSTLARTGKFSADVALSSTATNVRLQTPSTAAPDSLSPSTQYTIQYFYKANTDPGSNLDGGIYLNNTSGGTATDVNTIGAFASASWNKAYVERTTNSIYNASNWAVARISTPGSNIYLDTITFDDFVVYAGTYDSIAPGAPDPATMDSTYTVTGPSADLAWNAPSGGVDGGGYVVVKYLTMPAPDNDPNQNGIYAIGTTTSNGTANLLGTVIYIGTATSYSDTYTPGAYYKVYTADKAFNYSEEITLSEMPPLVGNSKQIIGEFPIMDGGMEGETSGTISTAGSSQSGTPQITWTVSSSGNSAQRLMVEDSTLARTGKFSADVALSSTATNVRLQTPSTAAPDSLSPSTQYTIQYFYKTNTDPGSNLDGGIYLNNTSGGTATDVNTIGAFASAGWNKAYVERTTNSIYNASNWAVARISTPGSNIYLDTITFDDFVVYAGTYDSIAPGAPDPATMDSTYTVTGPSADLAWNAPSGGVDGGGYIVVKYLTMPNADNDPNQNGIYAIGTTTSNGTANLLGTVIYIGTATSYSDTYTPGAYYKVYTADKAFNYSEEITLSEMPPLVGNSKQIIGEFPIMDGGMEGETSGTISTAGSSSSGTAQVSWSVSSSSNSAQRMMVEDSTLARTGRFSADVALAASATNVRLQSPSSQAPDSLNPATQYTIQYFYKANTDPGMDLDGGIYLNNTSGGVTDDITNLGAFASATWTKGYATITSGGTYDASNWGVARISTASAGTYLDTIKFDDFVVYAGALDSVAPDAATPPTPASIYTVNGSNADLAWVAPANGVDGGGYVVVKYLTMPNADNDINQNGIYAIGTTTSNGTANLLGTVVYIGTATSYTDTYTAGAYYKVYTADKAFNYSDEITLSELMIGVPDNEISDVTVYPNPAKNTLFINSPDLTVESISIYSLDGKEVLTQNELDNTSIDVSGLTNGVYVLKLIGDATVIAKKIIIE